MAEPLILLECASDPEEELEADGPAFNLLLQEAALSTLIRHFSDCANICPVISLGNSACGRSVILNSLLKEGQIPAELSEPETEDESFFESTNKPRGVYMWPRPIALGNVNLLLIKMWGVDFREEDEETAQVDQTLAALLAIGSVILLCAEKGSLFQSLAYVQEKYRVVRERTKLEAAKFVVFAENQAQLTRSNTKAHYSKLLASEFRDVTKVLFRGDRGISAECFSELKDLLATPETHMRYFASHQPVLPHIEARNFVHGITVVLQTILRVANLGLAFDAFISQIPNFTSETFARDIAALDDLDQSIRGHQTATALEFFARDSESYSINETVIETLQREYHLEKPTIVMVVMGHPGMGKSTLLNHIVKYNTGSRKLGSVFKTGNSMAHTTRASQVLSHPLCLGNSQLMLLDLEGLGGVETTNDRIAVLQANLISAILTICSVPCILVRNEVQNLHFVEKILINLCRLKEYFGFKIERIHLLFQDRDLQPGGFDNPQFIEHVVSLNRQYFEGKEVLRIKNKPNFSIREKAPMCKEFLEDLLKDSNFPKRNQSGSYANIANLLVEMKYIMSHHNTNLLEIRLSVVEMGERDAIERDKTSALQQIANSVICEDESMSLIAIFNERYRIFMGQVEFEIADSPINIRNHVVTALDNRAGILRLQLAQIEYCYRATRAMSFDELGKKVTEMLEYYYREAWWVNTFMDRANELKEKLTQIGCRYPREGRKIQAILEQFERKQIELRNWFIANYGFQIATSMMSGGLGIAAKGATLAANAARLGYAAILGGSALIGRWAYGATSTLALTETAMELYRVKGGQLRLNPKLTQMLSIEGDEPALTLLVIGTKRMNLRYLLNEFVRHVSPFTSSSLEAFKDSKLSQWIHFSYQRQDYEHEESRPVACKGLLAYIQMDESEGSALMKKAATALISNMSLTCLFVDQPEQYADEIIGRAFLSGEQVEWEISPHIPKVAVYYRAAHKRTEFLGKLLQIGVPSVAIPIQKFDPAELQSALVSVKGEFDVSAEVKNESLLRALERAEHEANRTD